jgi:transformation/transcription domain-associated protein
LVDTAVDESSVMVIPRHLLGASRRTSYEFCEMLLGHLVQHLERLCVPAAPGFVFFSKDPNGEDYEDTEKKRSDGKEEILEIEKRSLEVKEHQEKTASTYLELFERVIKSLSAFPENEKSIRPYLQKIIASSLRLSMEKGKDWPDNYCLLLRSLFRSISAGKFEDSYKEVLPMIPTILNGLYRIFQATEDESLQCIVIELCLTIPARLSSLLPHMPLLLRMIIPALKSSKEDLVNLG